MDHSDRMRIGLMEYKSVKTSAILIGPLEQWSQTRGPQDAQFRPVNPLTKYKSIIKVSHFCDGFLI